MDEARSTSLSSLALAQCPWQAPVPPVHASLDRTRDRHRDWAPRVLHLHQDGSRPPQTRHHGMPSQGGFGKRSAHTFAFVEEEKARASAKARLRGVIAASRILRPKLSSPAGVGLGSPHATSAPKPGSLMTHQHRILQAHLPPWLPLAGLRLLVCRRFGAHLACTAARMRLG
jgi:hypothetical protein